jgi:hypothetical protein
MTHAGTSESEAWSPPETKTLPPGEGRAQMDLSLGCVEVSNDALPYIAGVALGLQVGGEEVADASTGAILRAAASAGAPTLTLIGTIDSSSRCGSGRRWCRSRRRSGRAWRTGRSDLRRSSEGTFVNLSPNLSPNH